MAENNQKCREITISSREDMNDLENIILIWLNKTINENNDDYRKTSDDLQQITGLSKIFTNSKECMNYIKTIGKAKILLIICETFAEDILPQIDMLQTVKCVFIVYNDGRHNKYLHQNYSTTVMNISTDQQSLVKLVHRRIRFETEEAAFSIFDEDQKSTKDLKSEFALFLWSQLLLDVLRRFPNDRECAMKEMCDLCKNCCKDNKADLEEIERFSTTYEIEKNAVSWYTKNNFVHRILNEALRTGNIDYLYYFRFFIIDLSQQLKQERLKDNSKVTLYRGQRISIHEIDRLKRNVRSHIATNGFLSTSRNQEVATLYLRKGLSKTSSIQSVLFKITADSSLKSVTFADIEHLSQISDESEILFTLSSVFKIDEVYFADKDLHVWIVKMTLTNERSAKVHKYIDAVKEEYKELSTDVMFGRLLISMGELSKAESYLNRMLSTTVDNTLENAAFLVEMSNLSLRRNDYRRAEEMFNRAYAIRQNLLPKNHPLIGRSLSNLAAIFFFTSDVTKAIEYNKKALVIDRESFKGDHILISKDLGYLGKNYEAIDELDDALKHFAQALKMQKRLFYPVIKHPEIAGTLWSIGSVYDKKHHYKRALDHFIEALQIYEETLPCGHQQTIKLFSSIVNTHIGNKKFDDAFKFCETKLDQYQQHLEPGHSAIGKIQKLMGDIAFKCNDYEDAFKYFEQALKLLEGHKQPEHETTLECLNCLAETEKHRGNYSEALEYLKRSLKIQQKIYSPDQPQIAQTIRQIGLVHIHFQIYHKAEKCLVHALQIFTSKFKGDHDDVKITLENLKKVEQILKRN
jgi:tetratricopeptide (TPR) repeat protein